MEDPNISAQSKIQWLVEHQPHLSREKRENMLKLYWYITKLSESMVAAYAAMRPAGKVLRARAQKGSEAEYYGLVDTVDFGDFDAEVYCEIAEFIDANWDTIIRNANDGILFDRLRNVDLISWEALTILRSLEGCGQST